MYACENAGMTSRPGADMAVDVSAPDVPDMTELGGRGS